MAVAEVLAKVDHVRIKREDRVDAAALVRRLVGKMSGCSAEVEMWRELLELRRKWASGNWSDEVEVDAVAASCNKLHFQARVPNGDPHYWSAELDVVPDDSADMAFSVRVHTKRGRVASELELCGIRIEIKRNRGELGRAEFAAGHGVGGISVVFSDGVETEGQPVWGSTAFRK